MISERFTGTVSLVSERLQAIFSNQVFFPNCHMTELLRVKRLGFCKPSPIQLLVTIPMFQTHPLARRPVLVGLDP